MKRSRGRRTKRRRRRRPVSPNPAKPQPTTTARARRRRQRRRRQWGSLGFRGACLSAIPASAMGHLPSKLSPPDADARGFVLQHLPLDALYEVLLRLPAKDLCRLRAVCRRWRALLSDPQFVAAHAARHPSLLIVLGYHQGSYHVGHPNDGVACDLMDLSGHVVKRVHRADVVWVMSARFGLVGVARGSPEREREREREMA
ncbi:hypothetical protein ACP4OV_021129 [Aristida adscensionis]